MRRYTSFPALYFVSIGLLLVVFQQVWRLLLLVLTRDMAANVPGHVLAGSFLVGLRFDLAISGYIMLPLIALGMLPGWDIVRSRWARRINVMILSIVAAGLFFVHLADIEFFRFFNVRLNGTAHLWQDSPGVMFPMIWEMFPVVRYLLLYGIMLAIFLYIAKYLRRRLIERRHPQALAVEAVYAVVLLAVCVLAMRGRIEEKSPLRWGVAYFSTYAYANQLALSPAFTYFHDLVFDAGGVKQVNDLMASIDDPDAEEITRDLLGSTARETVSRRIHRRVTFDPPATQPANVVVIIMESFGSSIIGALDHQVPLDLSPRFDSLSETGLLFTNIYSAGMHTYTGLFATLYGYPAGFGNAVMKRALGRNHPWGLPQILQDHGYRTLFFATSDPHFDNMQGFLMANGVETVSSLFDYDPHEKMSSMGVPDHVMFDHALETLRTKTARPYCAVILTGSNHGPWMIPDVPMENVPDTTRHYTEWMAFKYSDWALGRFVRMLQADSAFDNTLVVVTADNGLPHLPVTDMDLTQYRIPLLLQWIGPNRPAPLRNDRLGSQMDIVSTVMGQVRLPYDDYTFGRDLLDTIPRGVPFAFFSEWYKIGYIEDDLFAIIRLNGPESLYDLNDPGTDVAASFPDVVADYRRKALAVYQTAYHNLQRPLNGPTKVP